jgi:hypothetical protein
MKFKMNGKEYTIIGVHWNQGKKAKYEFFDKEKIYEMDAEIFESKLTAKNYLG